MLFITRTTLSVPALMGAVMCIGVATSNSIFLVTFATGEPGTLPWPPLTTPGSSVCALSS